MRDGLKWGAELRMRAGEGVVELVAVMKRGLSCELQTWSWKAWISRSIGPMTTWQQACCIWTVQRYVDVDRAG